VKFPNRTGNKEAISDLIVQHFPPHQYYVEMFFGAGGIFFNKRPLAKHNTLNDISHEVYDLYECLLNEEKKMKLKELISLVPAHQDLMTNIYRDWYDHYDPVYRSAAFIIFSSYVFKGKGSTLRLGTTAVKPLLIRAFDDVVDFLSNYEQNITFTCKDFRELLPSIPDSDFLQKNGFVYCDPPYLNTGNNYAKNSHSIWKLPDFLDLLDTLDKHKVRFAISERDNPVVLELAAERELSIIPVAKMATTVGYRQEILLTNFPAMRGIFDYE
jgi:DNA adenine methylase